MENHLIKVLLLFNWSLLAFSSGSLQLPEDFQKSLDTDHDNVGVRVPRDASQQYGQRIGSQRTAKLADNTFQTNPSTYNKRIAITTLPIQREYRLRQDFRRRGSKEKLNQIRFGPTQKSRRTMRKNRTNFREGLQPRTSASEKSGKSLNFWVGNFSNASEDDLKNFYDQQQGRVSPYTPITFSNLFLQENLNSEQNGELEVEYDYQFGQDDLTSPAVMENPNFAKGHTNFSSSVFNLKSESDLGGPASETRPSFGNPSGASDFNEDDSDYMDMPNVSSGKTVMSKKPFVADLEPLFEIQFEEDRPIGIKPVTTKRPQPAPAGSKPFQPDFAIQIPADSSVSPNSKPSGSHLRPFVVEEEGMSNLPSPLNPSTRPFQNDLEPVFEVPFADSQTRDFPKPTRKPSKAQNPVFTPELEPDFSLSFNEGPLQQFPSSKPPKRPLRPDLQPDFEVSGEENFSSKPPKRPLRPDLQPDFEVSGEENFSSKPPKRPFRPDLQPDFEVSGEENFSSRPPKRPLRPDLQPDFEVSGEENFLQRPQQKPFRPDMEPVFEISFEASTTKRPGESIPQLPLSPVPVFSSSPFSTTTRPLGPDITTFRPDFDPEFTIPFNDDNEIPDATSPGPNVDDNEISEFDSTDQPEVVKNTSTGLIDFSLGERGPDGRLCINKTEHLESFVKEPLLECTHKLVEKCHYTYVTQFSSVQEEICDEKFEKLCQITFNPTTVTEKVSKCYRPIEKVCNGTGPETCNTVFETSCTTRYIQRNNSAGHVGETVCEKLPVKVCGPGCVTTEGPEVCHDKEVDSVINIPEEFCDLNPQKTCRHVTKLVPKLKPRHECTNVPKEVCNLKVGPAQKISKPIRSLWCLDESGEEI